MTYFILQTLFWLLAAFVIGLILGRWIKRLLCKQPKTMAYSTTTEEKKPSVVTYTNSADKLALRSAKDESTPSQPTETVAKKADSSISAGTAALGATAVGIAGHVASQALSDDEDTEIVKDGVQEIVDDEDESPVEDLVSKGVAAAGAAAASVAGLAMTGDNDDGDTNEVSVSTEDDSTYNLETDHQEVEELVDTDTEESIDTSTLEETTEAVETEVSENVESAIEENLDIDTSVFEEVAEVDSETISDAITDNIEGIEDKVDDIVDSADGSSLGDLLSTGATAAGAAAVAATGLATASDGEPSTDLEPSADKETSDDSSRPNSYLDSILGEGASVIAGIDPSKLRMIDGIGKKMEAILHDNDINTWKDLSIKSDTDLRDILDKYEDRYKGVELDGWTVQAALLADGKIDEIISLQKENGEESNLESLLKDS